ncbi:MAG: ribosome recycling factor [Acidimicrobiaceae bacterium]
MNELLELVLSEHDDKMQKAVEHAKAEFSSVRTGRASSSLVEKLVVEYYDSQVALQQLASFSVPEARLLVVNPFDKASMPAIEKAIRNSDLGLNPSNDGVVIRLVFPQLTAERRRELVKRVKHQSEEGKIAIRNLRRAARHEFDALVKDGDATEDDLVRAEKELDKLTHAHEAEIDAALDHKERELLEV